ncbi:DUF3486 family protein [Geobacter pelophilus]|uniref:DUF3486 family protein n=1 Tax=Geoanaerobacter pelophilus TaxID=60036 RepID=A0AAW4L5S2_9BACT|nr:DUF3486 family protein [Geoanaerobacter pelophilus]MBT0666346.1 DUF3486 family protein [Geoanaerobacter pelophilus]
MPQVSSIDRLPADIKAQLQQLLQDPRCTQLDATAKINKVLEEEGYPDRVTKSSVNRYAQRMEEVGEKLRQSREVAQMYIAHVGAAPQGQTGLLINEMLRSMAFELSLKLQAVDLEDPENMSATIDQVKALALAVQRLEQSATINIKRENDIRKTALADAAAEVEKSANTLQIKPETLAYIKQVIYGLAS